MVNELHLIALVQNCPFLYDRNHIEFRNVAKKNSAWKAIGLILKLSEVEVQQRWKALRETYNKYRKIIESTSSDSAIHWKYYDYMKFIEPHIQRRSGAYNKPEEVKEDTPKIINVAGDQREIPELIKLVQEKPILYDNKHKDYRNKTKKDQAWNAIASELGASATHWKKKWDNLRKTFRLYLKSNSLPDGSKQMKTYLYEKQLKFLIPFIVENISNRRRSKQVVTIGNEVIEITDESSDEEEENEIENTINNLPVDVVITTEKNTIESGTSTRTLEQEEAFPLAKRIKREDSSTDEVNSTTTEKETPLDDKEVDRTKTEEQFDSVMEERQDLSKKVSNVDPQDLENDPDLLFFRSLLPELHQMTSQQRSKFRLAVLTSMDKILNESS